MSQKTKEEFQMRTLEEGPLLQGKLSPYNYNFKRGCATHVIREKEEAQNPQNVLMTQCMQTENVLAVIEKQRKFANQTQVWVHIHLFHFKVMNPLTKLNRLLKSFLRELKKYCPYYHYVLLNKKKRFNKSKI